jgi:hypothetical protein
MGIQSAPPLHLSAWNFSEMSHFRLVAAKLPTAAKKTLQANVELYCSVS